MLNNTETTTATLSDSEKAEILYQTWPENGSDLYRMTTGRDGHDNWRLKGQLTDADIYAAFDLLRDAGRLYNMGQGWIIKR